MEKVKFGIIGVGGMGASHLDSMKTCVGAELAAVCDMNRECADRVAKANNVKAYYDAVEMYQSGDIDAVLIVTPHYSHTPLAVAAFENGIHVLSDKPIAVHKADAFKMLAAQEKAEALQFGVMYQLRTSKLYQKIKQLIADGELGEIRRVNWTATHWFRTQAYYDSGAWRATWKGEGGGVLMNQCPHQLDLFQWFFGMPSKVRAFGSLGKYHKIEVEDDVTAYFEFPGGATGMFIASTGECPGSDRIEISADRGLLVCEGGKLNFRRTDVSVAEYTVTSKERMTPIGTWECDIPVQSLAVSATELIDAFAKSIVDPACQPLVTGREGMNSVELINAMLYSMLEERDVELPLDPNAFADTLQRLISESENKK